MVVLFFFKAALGVFSQFRSIQKHSLCVIHPIIESNSLIDADYISSRCVVYELKHSVRRGVLRR
jgi:hypothetical protein